MPALLGPRLAPTGRAFLIVPWERRHELENGFAPARSLRVVSHTADSPPGKAIVELRAGAGPCESLPPLILFADAAKKEYTAEFGKFLAGGLIPAP